MATGIPIDDLVKFPFQFENECANSIFPLVAANGATYKVSVDQIFFNNAVSSSVLQDSSIITTKLADLNVTTIKIADQAVIPSKIKNNSISSEQIKIGGIKNCNMAGDNFQACFLLDKAIDNRVIADNSINSVKIQSGAVNNDKILDGAVTTGKLNDLTVTGEKIANDTITSSKIDFIGDNLDRVDGSLLIHRRGKYNSSTMSGDGTLDGSGKFNLNAISTDKILDDAVTTSKIKNENITTAKIAKRSITNEQIALAGISNENMQTRSIEGNILREEAISNLELADDSVSTRNIQDQSISPQKIQNNTITSQQIAFAGISNANMKPRSIQGLILQEGAINNAELANNSVDNNKIDNGDFTFNSINNVSENVDINGIGYKFPSSLTNERFLKHSSSGQLEWVTPTEFSERAPTTVLDKVLPIGSIMPYGANTLPADGKFLPCDGTERNTSDFPELSKLIKGIYGTASSNAKFKLPDLRGRVPVGLHSGDSNFNSLGKSAGSNSISIPTTTGSHKLKVSEMPSHNHTDNVQTGRSFSSSTGSAPIAQGSGSDVRSTAQANIPTTDTGGNGTHCHTISFNGTNKNIQKYNTIQYIIKAIPDRVVQLDIGLGKGLLATTPTSQNSNITLNSNCLSLNPDNNTIKFNNRNQLIVSAELIQELKQEIQDASSKPVFVKAIDIEPNVGNENNNYVNYNARTLLGLAKAPRAIIIDQEWATGQAPGSFSRFRIGSRGSGQPEYKGVSINAGGGGDIESNTFQGTFPVASDGSFQYKGYTSSPRNLPSIGFRIIGYFS